MLRYHIGGCRREVEKRYLTPGTQAPASLRFQKSQSGTLLIRVAERGQNAGPGVAHVLDERVELLHAQRDPVALDAVRHDLSVHP